MTPAWLAGLEALRPLLDALPFAVWARDATGRVVFNNAAVVERWGDQVGKTVDQEALPEGTRQRWERRNARAMAGETVVELAEHDLTDDGGATLAVVVPLRGADGAIEGIAGVNFEEHQSTAGAPRIPVEGARDRQAARMALLHTERLASLGLLAASVGHEIRNAAAGANAFLLELRATFDAARSAQDLALETVREDLRTALAGVTRIALLARDLQAFARPRSPGVLSADLGDAVRAALSLATAELRHAQVDLELGEVAAVRGDPLWLGQIALNLLLNAAHAVEGRRGHIRIRTRAEEGRARLEVEDDGPGVAAEIRPHVFEPFRTTRAGGTGLGLYLVHQIVLELGGEVALEDRDGGGTRAVVFLPLAPP